MSNKIANPDLERLVQWFKDSGMQFSREAAKNKNSASSEVLLVAPKESYEWLDKLFHQAAENAGAAVKLSPGPKRGVNLHFTARMGNSSVSAVLRNCDPFFLNPPTEPAELYISAVLY